MFVLKELVQISTLKIHFSRLCCIYIEIGYNFYYLVKSFGGNFLSNTENISKTFTLLIDLKQDVGSMGNSVGKFLSRQQDKRKAEACRRMMSEQNFPTETLIAPLHRLLVYNLFIHPINPTHLRFVKIRCIV